MRFGHVRSRVTAWLYLGGVAAAAIVAGCTNPPYPQGPLSDLFPNPPRPEEHRYRVEGRDVHYLQMDGGPARILFVHGSPGDWKAWATYLGDARLRQRATLIAVDRPGFGDSGPGQVAPTIKEQARLLEPLLKGEGAPTLIVGHSLGGPISGELAMDYPDEVRGAVLVAPSIDPATEQPRWYNDAMTWRVIQWITPGEFAWSNEELMPLDAELQEMAPRWSQIRVPVTIIQGEKDELVDPRTADFAEAALPKALGKVIRVPDQGHFVLWKRPELVVEQILEMLDRTRPSETPPASAVS